MAVISATAKPKTDHFPAAVLGWIAGLLVRRRAPVEIYHEMGTGLILCVEIINGEAKRTTHGNKESMPALAERLLDAYLPGETMPPPPKKRRAPAPAPAPTPPPTIEKVNMRDHLRSAL